MTVGPKGSFYKFQRHAKKRNEIRFNEMETYLRVKNVKFDES